MLIPFGVFSAAGAGGGAAAGAYELISTAYGTGSSSTVSFSSIPSTYKHLQIRMVSRSGRSATSDPINIQFNGDTGTNYVKYHRLGGNGSTVVSDTEGAAAFIQVAQLAGSTAGADIYGVGVVDILDYTGTKNKTTKSFMGLAVPNFVNLMSGLWMSTATISSITLTSTTANNFTTASRFSLYGIRG